MEFSAERGSVSVASLDAIRGAVAGTIRFRLKVESPRHSRRKGRSRIPITSSVNSPAGNDYGSPSVDCHYRLRSWTARLVRVHRLAFAAAKAGAVRAGVPDTGDDRD